jgi:hypothetical protein
MSQAVLESTTLEATENRILKKSIVSSFASSQVSPNLISMLPINPNMTTFFEFFLLVSLV